MTNAAPCRTIAGALLLVAAIESSAAEKKLVTGVTFSNPTPCSGETFRVEVATRHPQGGNLPVLVFVDGRPGNRRDLRFLGPPGRRLVHVLAQTETGDLDSRIVEVALADCRAPAGLRIVEGHNPYHPTRLDLRVHGGSPTGPYEWLIGNSAARESKGPYLSYDYARHVTPGDLHLTLPVRVRDAGGGRFVDEIVTIPSDYAWARKRGRIRPLSETFPVERGLEPEVRERYVVRNVESAEIVFDAARLELQACDASRRAEYRTLMPARAFSAPLLRPEAPPNPTTRGGPRVGVGSSTGARAAAAPIVALDGARITASASVDLAMRQLRDSAGPFLEGVRSPVGLRGERVVLAPSTTHEGTIAVDSLGIPSGICSLGLHLLGAAPGGRSARWSLYVDLRSNPNRSRRVESQALKSFLGSLAAQKLVLPGTPVTDEDLYRLRQEGRIERVKGEWRVSQSGPAPRRPPVSGIRR